MKSKLVIFSLLLIFLIIPLTTANEIGIVNEDNVKIDEWEEIDKVIGLDLHVAMDVKVIVDREILNRVNHFYFQFTPWEENEQGATRDINFSVCDSGITNPRLEGDDIFSPCDEKIDSIIGNIIRYAPSNYKRHNLTVNLSDLDWNNQQEKALVIKIRYIIPNFISKEPYQLIQIETICFSSIEDGCPLPTEIKKHVILPKGAYPEKYPDGAYSEITSEDLQRITIYDFTPSSRYEGAYSDKSIWYTNYGIEQRRNIKIGVYIALIFGTIASILVAIAKHHLVDKKNNTRIQENIDELGDDIKENIDVESKKLYNKLKELESTRTSAKKTRIKKKK